MLLARRPMALARAATRSRRIRHVGPLLIIVLRDPNPTSVLVREPAPQASQTETDFLHRDRSVPKIFWRLSHFLWGLAPTPTSGVLML